MSQHGNHGYSHLIYSHTVTEKTDPLKFERHCHNSYEILYVVRGAGKYVVEGVEYPLGPQTLLLTRPYEYHYVCPSKNVLYERYVINFDGDVPLDAAADLPMLKGARDHAHGVYFDTEAISERVRAEFAEMDAARTLFRDSPDRIAKEETMIRMSLSRILLLLSLAKPSATMAHEENIVTRVIEFLNLHLTAAFSLDKLAQQFFVSKYYLCHAFRKQTGISVFTYITTKRIAMAQQLLANGEPATAVAYQVGFSNYSSFYRAYCKQTGQAPAYRREDNMSKGVNDMRIRKATAEDLPQILQIYADARAYMRENGNPGQWGDHYPSTELIREDIQSGACHVCEDSDGMAGVFYFALGEDPTYATVCDGKWLNDRPYGVIHRIAVAKHRSGVASLCFAYAFEKCGNLKIDTHRDNIPMQRSLAKNGFSRCGIIHLQNGEARIAYQKSSEK